MQFPGQGKPPVGVVFNCDLAAIDDVLALALLYGFDGRNEARVSVRLTLSKNRQETGRRIKASLASVRRGAYKDYDADGLRALVRDIVAEIGQEKSIRTKRS